MAPFAVRLFEDDKTWVEPDIRVICRPEILITVYPLWSDAFLPPKTHTTSSTLPVGIYDGDLSIDFGAIIKEL